MTVDADNFRSAAAETAVGGISEKDNFLSMIDEIQQHFDKRNHAAALATTSIAISEIEGDKGGRLPQRICSLLLSFSATLAHRGEDGAALSYMRLLYAYSPETPQYLVAQAMTLDARGDWGGATRSLRRCSFVDGDSAPFQFVLAKLSTKMKAEALERYFAGDLSTAEHILDRLIDMNPRDDEALYYMSLVMKSQSDQRRAWSYFFMAVAINPDLKAADVHKKNLIALFISTYDRLIANGQEQDAHALLCDILGVDRSQQERAPSNGLTIAIPTWNRAELLDQCLDRIVREVEASGVAVRVIVSDNGSTDRTPEICAKYSKRYEFIRAVRFPVNLGFSLNFLKIMLECGTTHLWPMGDDDAVRPGSILEIVSLIQECPFKFVKFIDDHELYCQDDSIRSEMNLFEACNDLGFFTILGFISEIIFDTTGITIRNMSKLLDDSYPHSLLIYSSYWNEKILVKKHPLLEKDNFLKKETCAARDARWESEAVYFRMLHSVKSLAELILDGRGPPVVDCRFFHSGPISIFDVLAVAARDALMNRDTDWSRALRTALDALDPVCTTVPLRDMHDDILRFVEAMEGYTRSIHYMQTYEAVVREARSRGHQGFGLSRQVGPKPDARQ